MSADGIVLKIKVDLLVRPEVMKRLAFGTQLSIDDIINPQQTKALF
jgi:hypothetical protein